MDEDSGHTLTIPCECGHEFTVSLRRKDIELQIFTCPTCERKSHLTPEQITAVSAAIREQQEIINKAVRDAAAGMFKGS
jgi:hypothetical protein